VRVAHRVESVTRRIWTGGVSRCHGLPKACDAALGVAKTEVWRSDWSSQGPTALAAAAEEAIPRDRHAITSRPTAQRTLRTPLRGHIRGDSCMSNQGTRSRDRNLGSLTVLRCGCRKLRRRREFDAEVFGRPEARLAGDLPRQGTVVGAGRNPGLDVGSQTRPLSDGSLKPRLSTCATVPTRQAARRSTAARREARTVCSNFVRAASRDAQPNGASASHPRGQKALTPP
jgi:hypothetical protein